MNSRQLKKEIIEKTGIKTSEISVRSDIYSINIRTTRKDKLKQIERIAGKLEHIDRDERSGEILSGGNTFVFVDYRETL